MPTLEVTGRSGTKFLCEIPKEYGTPVKLGTLNSRVVMWFFDGRRRYIPYDEGDLWEEVE